MIEEHLELPRDSETQEVPLRTAALHGEFLLEPLSKVMRTQLATISPNEGVGIAAEAMAEGHFGCVLVTEGDVLVGILSERDIVTRIVAKGMDAGDQIVRDVMTPNPETLTAEDQLVYALNIMAVGGFRHVPVVADGCHLIGIVSIRDIHRAVLEHFEQEILTLPPRPVRDAAPQSRYGG